MYFLLFLKFYKIYLFRKILFAIVFKRLNLCMHMKNVKGINSFYMYRKRLHYKQLNLRFKFKCLHTIK